MTTAIITERIAQPSPRFKAQDFEASGFRAQGFRTSGLKTKSAGVIYLLSILAVAFADDYRSRRVEHRGRPVRGFGHDRSDAAVLWHLKLGE